MRTFAPLALASSLMGLFAFGTGCTYAAADEDMSAAESEITAVASTKVATVEKRSLERNEGKCEISMAAIDVTLDDTAVADKINANLGKGFEKKMAQFPCDNKLAVSGTMKAVFNKSGWLSVRTDQSVQQPSEERPFLGIRSENFDLETGARLQLTDIIDASGLSTFKAVCAGQLKCNGSMPTSYAVEDKGIRLWPSAVDPQKPDESVLLSWAEIGDHIANATLKSISGS